VHEVLTSEDAKVLIAFCRAGKLYEIEKWIASGKSIRTPPEIKKPPLHVAIALGFHSLVELLVPQTTLADEVTCSFPRPSRLPEGFERLLAGGRRENRECELAYFGYKPFQFT
jgi:hypothetical protein